MNTTPKPIRHLLCRECGEVFGKSGENAFRYSRPVLPDKEASSTPVTGLCPKHPPKRDQ